MRRALYKELGKMLLLSCGIFGVFFLVLYMAESLLPQLKGVLLHWQDPAFLVGIPASVVGVAYVLTIRNPKNYTGFILGIVMSLLLAWQFYLQGNMDLVLLYTLIFPPFMALSIRAWRQSTLGLGKEDKPLEPSFVEKHMFLLLVSVFAAVVALDYVLVTRVINHDGWSDAVLIKLLGGTMIASSLLANILMIRQRNDAWINWVIYSAAGVAFYVVIGNLFSILLFVVFLIINARAQAAWLKLTTSDNRGWTARSASNDKRLTTKS